MTETLSQSASSSPSPAPDIKPRSRDVTDGLEKVEQDRHLFKGAGKKCAICGKQADAPAHGDAQPIAPAPRQLRWQGPKRVVSVPTPNITEAVHVEREKPQHNAPRTHKFKGADLAHCSECGKPVTNTVHSKARDTKSMTKLLSPEPNDGVITPKIVSGDGSNVRHAGPGHENVPTGHVKGVPKRHIKAAGDQAARHMKAVEGPLEASLKSLFSEQRKATINRLNGKRGKAELKRAADELTRANGDPNEPPVIPPEDSGTTPPPAPPSVDPAAVFDQAYCASKAAEVLGPHLTTAATLAAQGAANQLQLDPMVDDSTSMGALRDIIAARAQEAADYISGTTAGQLTEALQQGVAEGEGIAAIGKRINDVFDQADITRAKRIAQTEVVGAYNEGAHAYASQLPSDVIGTRRWLSHHDDRTRPTHRVADGQEQPMDAPFYVGGYPMAYPGDKAAPVGEWINCRCSVAYLPPGMSYDGIAAAAAAYVAGLKAKPPTPVSPYAISGT